MMDGNSNGDNKDSKLTPEPSTRNVETRSSSKRILNASIDGSPSKGKPTYSFDFKTNFTQTILQFFYLVSHNSSFCQLPTNQKIREGNEFQAQVPAASGKAV